MVLFQTAMLLGMGIGLTLIGICRKSFMSEALTWLTVLLALTSLTVQTLSNGHFPVG